MWRKSHEVLRKEFRDSKPPEDRSTLRKEAKDRAVWLPVAWQPPRSKASVEGLEVWFQKQLKVETPPLTTRLIKYHPLTTNF